MKNPSAAPGTGTEAPCGLVPQRTPLDGLRTAGSPLVAPNKKSLHRQLGGGGRCRAGFKRRSAERVAGPVDPKVDGQLVVMRNAQPHDTMARARVQGPSTKTSHKEQGDSAERAQPGAEQRGRRRPALQQPPRGRGPRTSTGPLLRFRDSRPGHASGPARPARKDVWERKAGRVRSGRGRCA